MKANLIPTAAAAYLVFILFFRLYLRSSVIARIGLTFLSLLLAVPAVLFISNYVLLIPYASWFYKFHAMPGVEISSGLIGAIIGILFASSKLRPGKLNAPILAICTTGAVILLITPFAKQIIFGVNYSGLKDTWKDRVCLQSSGYTCVPASIATIARLQGGHLTERELAQAAGTTRRGTEIWYMVRALRAKGYELRYRRCSIRKATVPSMIGVNLGNIGHAVVLMKRHGDEVVIGDPMKGEHSYSISNFEKYYHPGNSCVTIKQIQ